jgi:O-antigen ligase
LGEVTARRDIWAAAWGAFASHPWRGLGAGGFPAYWAEFYGGEAVQHAHNLWLEFAASYGVLGLASAIALTFALGALAWRWGGARALLLVAGVLLMNVFDTTLFYTGVLFSLALALGTFRTGLRSRAGPLHAAPANASHNAEVAAPPSSQVPPS